MTFMLHETLLFTSQGPEDSAEKDVHSTCLLTKNE